MAEKYSEIIKQLGKDRVRSSEPLASYTTFKIGGPADLFYEAETSEELVRAIKLCRQLKIPFFILAGGSKLLISDKGFRGSVIKVQTSEIRVQDTKITAEAGVNLKKLLELAAEKGLSGLEFLAGIPGTVGGAIVGNAGAWQKNIGDRVERVQVLTLANQIEWLEQEDCRFDYRQSRFKKDKEIVLAAEFSLVKDKPEEIKKRMKDFLEKRAIQPKESSAGCIFINPKPLSAGKMIDECGLKGEKRGQAQISEKHANFFVNLKAAQAKDVLALIKLAQERVKEKFKIDLEKEIHLVGFAKI